ncbi:unnamed protein product [Linum trigynum]|uniref:Uncharacterized protein n=1 Tax=Linum trigynum TaxID=586398 RepID=A0AAV2GAL4_9ROSI
MENLNGETSETVENGREAPVNDETVETVENVQNGREDPVEDLLVQMVGVEQLVVGINAVGGATMVSEAMEKAT